VGGGWREEEERYCAYLHATFDVPDYHIFQRRNQGQGPTAIGNNVPIRGHNDTESSCKLVSEISTWGSHADSADDSEG
jgi:hypothetical protein